MVIQHKLNVITPAGKCPVMLEGTDLVSVRKWVLDVRASRPRYHLTKKALKYWVRHTYPYLTPEHALVMEQIDKILKG